MLWFLRVHGFFLLLVTLLPLWSTGRWFVRWWDFPRLQLAILLLATMILAACLIGKPARTLSEISELRLWLVLLAGAIFWQGSHILPFSSVWPKEVPDRPRSVDTDTIKLMVANLDYENKSSTWQVIEELEREQADVLLLIEVDDAWQDGLSPLRANYRYHYDHVRGEGLGMCLWSNLKLANTEVRHLVSERRASIWAQIESTTGHPIQFVGVHPTPPGLLDSTGDTRRDSRVRDAELVLIAREITENRKKPWIVAGDFNDVAWSHTTRLFKRISGLRDPRVGRSFMGTYVAQYPPLRCPIDHVFLSADFSIGSLSRKRIPGSDHFAVLATVALSRPAAEVTPSPQGDDREDADEMVKEGERDAADRGVSNGN